MIHGPPKPGTKTLRLAESGWRSPFASTNAVKADWVTVEVAALSEGLGTPTLLLTAAHRLQRQQGLVRAGPVIDEFFIVVVHAPRERRRTKEAGAGEKVVTPTLSRSGKLRMTAQAELINPRKTG
jgi:hypothetical protein